MSKPYVVSADIKILLEKWAEKSQFVIPNEAFFAELRSEFSRFMKDIFPRFELVEEGELVSGINRIIEATGLTSISLDRVYVGNTKYFLDMARKVNSNGEDQGVGHRAGSPTLRNQFIALRNANAREIILVDDVVFTGDLIERVTRCLRKIGIEAPLVCAGIAIGEGVDKIVKSGSDIFSVRAYDEVIDEICERDFYPGVPFSGRLVSYEGVGVGVPYILPFGNPEKWASIPENRVKIFSRFCIEQTAILFHEIGVVSGRDVMCRDLPRGVIGISPSERVFADVITER